MDDTIKSDIRIIIGGNFTPDGIGPDRYEEVVGRVHTSPESFIESFESMFLGHQFDALEQSTLHLPLVLKIASESAPDRAKEVSQLLLNQYNAVLLVYDSAENKDSLHSLLPEDTIRLFHRLNDKRRDLKNLMSSIDNS